MASKRDSSSYPGVGDGALTTLLTQWEEMPQLEQLEFSGVQSSSKSSSGVQESKVTPLCRILLHRRLISANRAK